MLTQGSKTGYEGEWMTPPDLIEWIKNRFGKFDLDIAASKDNHICRRYFSKKNSAFENAWKCKNGFINPDFSNAEPYCKGAWYYTSIGVADQIIMIMPVSFVGNKWWNDVEQRGFSHRIELGPRVNYIPHPLNPKSNGNDDRNNR